MSTFVTFDDADDENISAFGDINFDAHAYTFGVISVVSNAAYLTTLQKTGMEKNIGAISIAYINR